MKIEFKVICNFYYSSDEMMKELKCNKDNKATLVASWKFIAGDVNFRAMHLFRYPEVKNHLLN